ncbi:MAG: hypothetical protein A2792_01100 [Sphingomonadales bacterium RIFCSPHIGHO2_01_FULL_65_20]|nr:MAG: hypothetical protein A2792_01100 [Sphingomonadales bacterium RIFCSPHIGHO2_01_FULL_65_20]
MLKIATLSVALMMQSWGAIDVGIDSETWLLDYSSKTPTRYGLAVWVKSIKPNGEYMMTNYLIDCDDRTLGARAIVKYTSAGRIVDSYSHPDVLVQKTPAVPETVGASIIRAACAR